MSSETYAEKQEITEQGRDRRAMYQQFHDSLKNDYYSWQKFLDSWLGKKFHREIAFGYGEGGMVRKNTTGTNHMINQMLFFCDPAQNEKRGRGNPQVYVSVFNFDAFNEFRPDYSTWQPNKMLFDFDGEIAGDVPTIAELEQPYKEAITLQKEDAFTLFSGKKGFQAHLPFQGSKADLEKLSLRDRQLRIEALWELVTTSDNSVYGDATQVCRMPYSVHAISGLQSIPLKKNEPLSEVLERARSFTKPEVVA